MTADAATEIERATAKSRVEGAEAPAPRSAEALEVAQARRCAGAGARRP